MNYYCFVAGLPDIHIESGKSVPAMTELCDELTQLLSPGDRKLLNVLRMSYDNSNLLALLSNRDAEINPLATITKEEWQELIDLLNDEDEPFVNRNRNIPAYAVQFLQEWRDARNKENNTTSMQFPEERLAALYYNHGMNCGNKLLREWFALNLNMNNILTALTCRKYNWDIKARVVGDNEVAETIRKSVNARDFNLRTELDYFDTVVNISEVENLLDRERRIDQMKWNWLENSTFFETFSIEKILVFWIRCELIHRWDDLNQERGSEIFRNMINEMKKDVKF